MPEVLTAADRLSTLTDSMERLTKAVEMNTRVNARLAMILQGFASGAGAAASITDAISSLFGVQRRRR